MAVLLEKSIFIHIPKTGGTFVRDYLVKDCHAEDISPIGQVHEYGMANQHQTPDMLNPDIKEGRKLFTFVRHPVSWYKSYWRYKAISWDWDKNHILECCADHDINKFIDNVYEKHPKGYLTKIIKKYIKGVDFIGRQESLRDDLASILLQTGDDFNNDRLQLKGRTNVSEYEPIFSVYTQQSIEKILEIESWVIDKFYKIKKGK